MELESSLPSPLQISFPNLGKMFRAFMHDRDKSCQTVAENLAHRSGITKAVASNYLTNFRQGHIYRIRERPKLRVINKERYFFMIQNIFDICDVPSDHLLITRMREIDPSFEYPPQRTSSNDPAVASLLDPLLAHSPRSQTIEYLLALNDERYGVVEKMVHQLHRDQLAIRSSMPLPSKASDVLEDYQI